MDRKEKFENDLKLSHLNTNDDQDIINEELVQKEPT